MRRHVFYLIAFFIWLSIASTTCDDSIYINVSVVNESSEPVKCISVGKYYDSNSDKSLSVHALGAYPTVLPTMEHGDTLTEVIAVSPNENWDKAYQTFIFFSENNIEGDKNEPKPGVARCYTLTELKNMDWTVIYKGNEK